MKFRITTLTVALLLLATGLFAQEEVMEKKTSPNFKKFAIGGFAGFSNYQGDLIVPTYASVSYTHLTLPTTPYV